jgi:hypothetical protein
MSTPAFFGRLLRVVLLVVALPAQANTDYRCLNLCVQSGHPQYNCMSQCSTAPSLVPNQSQPLSGSIQNTDPSQSSSTQAGPSSAGIEVSGSVNHRLLAALTPLSNDEVVLSQIKPSSSAVNQEKNYVCMQRCLESKMEYDTCNDSCTTTTTKNGSQVLRDGQTQIVGAGTQPGQIMDFLSQPTIPVTATKAIHPE